MRHGVACLFELGAAAFGWVASLSAPQPQSTPIGKRTFHLI